MSAEEERVCECGHALKDHKKEWYKRLCFEDNCPCADYKEAGRAMSAELEQAEREMRHYLQVLEEVRTEPSLRQATRLAIEAGVEVARLKAEASP